MSEDAADRKKRLALLKEAAALKEAAGAGEGTPGHTAGEPQPQLKFRNYQVQDADHVQHKAVSMHAGLQLQSRQCGT